MTVLYIILAILIFGFLIFIHEGGHYLTARLFKVSIREFSIGMGPKIISKKSKKTGIAYSWRAFPIGGFVDMVGENAEEGSEEDENAFYKKAVWKRIIITAAGALTNLIFGIIVMSVFVATTNIYASTTIAEFPEDTTSVIQESGLQVDDKIVGVDGKTVHTYSQMSYAIMHEGYEPVDITVIRDGEKITVENVVFPTVEEQGVTFGDFDFKVYRLDKTFPNVVKEANYQSFTTIKMIWDSLIDLISGRYGVEAVSGPVGVTEALVDAAKTDFRNLIYLTVVISMNLGVMNLLPLPALDGGRLLFQLIELVAGRPINRKIEGYIHTGGLAVLMLFMAVIVVKDVVGLF